MIWDDMARQTSVDKFKKTGISDLGRWNNHSLFLLNEIMKSQLKYNVGS